MILSRLVSSPLKSGIRVSRVVSGFNLLMAIIVSRHKIEPLSFKSSLSTYVTTACFITIIWIDFATLIGSFQSTSSGLPVFTLQKPHDLVQVLPRIINVAVPSPQHSPIFGQLPDEHIVLSLYLSTSFIMSE